jgi:HK97 family phage prohead protease
MPRRQIPNDQPFYRELTFERASVNKESRSVDVSFSSETDTVIRWGEPEILDHSVGSVDLTRLNTMGVVLFNHDYNQVIGRVTNARIENNRGLATLIFDEDEDSEKIFQKVLSGTLRGTSAGYSYIDYSWLSSTESSSDGRFKGPCLLVKRWKVNEISIASVPADDTVGVGRSMGDSLRPLIEGIVQETIVRMTTEKPPAETSKPEKRSLETYQRKLKLAEKAI